uniref:Uncharacterized protein n=3 Tax=Bionectria ochroleuca TaxID=29856 RepID=A0A0B7JZL8_BIOOC
MDRSQPASSNLMDIHERLVADILTRYRTLMMLATIQSEGERINEKPEAMAITGISMKMEFDGLYSSVKELLALSRKMKELWVFGALGKDPGHEAKDEQIESDVAKVAALLGEVEASGMKGLAEKYGGTWEPLSDESLPGAAPTGANAAAAPGAAPAPTTETPGQVRA